MLSGIANTKWNKEETSIREINHPNPLLRAFCRVLKRLNVFKEMARDFYFDVLLSVYLCPACGGRMRMTRQSEVSCACGLLVDPTVQFQRSQCCGAKLARKTFHYACSHCGKNVPSKFIFNEKLFDPGYFRTMMRESRERKRRKMEEVKRMLASSRSGPLTVADMPELNEIHGLKAALDEFIITGGYESLNDYAFRDEFNMDEYKTLIFGRIRGCGILFSAIPPLCEDMRKDLARRFTTLIYMWQDRLVDLTQYCNDILVEKYEAHIEG